MPVKSTIERRLPSSEESGAQRLDLAVARLNQFYSECPEVSCMMCGGCCVDPHMTFVEFVALMDDLVFTFKKEELARLVAKPPVPSLVFEGHNACPMQKDNLCEAREGRTLSCRLEGLAVMDSLFRRDPPLCANAAEKALAPPVGEAYVEGLLAKLLDLNSEFYTVMAPPYHLDGLTVRCWLAVCLDRRIKAEPFTSLAKLARRRYNLAALERNYVDNTGLAEKIALIDDFNAAFAKNQYREAAGIIEKIQTGFPNTGTFFYWQASAWACHIQSLLA